MTRCRTRGCKTVAGFCDNLSPEDALKIDRLAGLFIELRESRAALLARHGANDEAGLLAMIRAREIPEHPAYEDYLGARLHQNLSTFPNHLHDPHGSGRADPLTEPGREPWRNLRAVLDAILDNPLL